MDFRFATIVSVVVLRPNKKCDLTICEICWRKLTGVRVEIIHATSDLVLVLTFTSSTHSYQNKEKNNLF